MTASDVPAITIVHCRRFRTAEALGCRCSCALVAPDAHCGDGLIEGNIAERERSARSAYAEHIRIELGSTESTVATIGCRFGNHRERAGEWGGRSVVTDHRML